MATVNISVTLDTSANPPVTVSNRNQLAASGDTIKFQRAGGQTLDIASFAPSGAGTVFTNPTPGGSGQWLTVDFTSSTEGSFPYTLTVTAAGVSYDTTETEQDPDNRRPVIRN